MTFLLFILLLVVLILVHEFGHFIVAKAFGIKVEEFGIFFPPRIASVQWGETVYSLNWLPFGGFVKIFGESVQDENKEAAKDPRSFVHQPRLVQAAVVVAGICFNLLFAWLALSAGYMVGMQTSADHKGFGQVTQVRTTIVGVLPEGPADKAGIMAEDRVLAIRTGTAELAPPIQADSVQKFIRAHQEESMLLTVERPLKDGGREEKIFLAKPAEGIASDAKVIGIELDDVGLLTLPPHTALLQGALLTKDLTVAVAEGLGSFLYRTVTGAGSWAGVAGPIGIVGIGAGAVEDGLLATIMLVSLISINLAVINLLPIPGLDGGRLLFISIESILRRPLSEKLSLRLTIFGFALLLLAMVVVSFHDIARLIKIV